MIAPQTVQNTPPPFLRRVLRYSRRKFRFALWRVESIFGKHLCNVCGRRVGRFLSLSETHPGTLEHAQELGFSHEMEMLNIEHYSCPFCGSTDRDRLFALYLDEAFARNNGAQGMHILDFAPVRCLSAFVRGKLRDHAGSYRTADLFMPNVDDKVDLMDMHVYRDGQFDFFICSHVLEHVKDDGKALRELLRVTKPGGAGIVMVPVALDIKEVDEDVSLTDEAEAWRRFGQNDHVRLYSKKGLVERVRQSGFDVAELGVAHFGAEKWEQLAILPGSILYIATRPK
jgi:SAM-dependent methyltransferase